MPELPFRNLALRRNRDSLKSLTEDVEAMGHEVAAYWLGLGMRRHEPWRPLTLLRRFPTIPKR